jgi:DNA polymerase
MTQQPTVHGDFESRSAADLPKVGAHRYSEDPTTEIICFSYQPEGEAVRRAERWGAFCRDVDERLRAGARFVCHNATFERAMWNEKADHELRITPEMQDCTLARAAACGLPASLDNLAKALRTKVQKDTEGYRLMLKMCKPKTLDPLTWHESPEEIERLQAYCDQDVLTESAIDKLLPPLTERERRVWELDQHINDRGVQIDVDMVSAALACAEEATKRANQRIWRLTSGAVKRVTEAAKIAAWINSQGVPCTSIAAGEHEELILGAEVLDQPQIEEVIKLRASSAKAFKFKAMLDSVCRDGRVRGSLRYHATIQGRWAGAGVQFHNMKRVETDEDAADVTLAVGILKSGKRPAEMVDEMELLFPAPLELLSICARTAVIARPGYRLVGGDFSNIEGRVNAWLAGQKDKLDAFRRYDSGTGPDLYKVTAAQIIEIPVEDVSRAQRQEQGKVPELACGYQGSLGAFKKMGAKYGVRLPDARIRQIVAGWRDVNPAIVSSWAVLQEAAIEAVGSRGCVVSVLNDRIRYVADKGFLYCKLPSGRVIHYPSPTLAWKSKTIIIDDDEVVLNRNTVSYWTSEGGRWMQKDLYGGAQCAHVVSGIARDILVEGMFRVEATGYPLVLTIHDEGLSEVPEGFGSKEEYLDLLLQPIEWMDDCPISASTWEGPRYIK